MIFLLISTSAMGALFGLGGLLFGLSLNTALQIYILFPVTMLALYMAAALLRSKKACGSEEFHTRSTPYDAVGKG